MCSSADLDLDPPVTFDEVHQFCAAVKGSVPSPVFDSFVEVAMRLPAAGVPAFVACAHIEAVLGDKGSYELLMQLGILYPPYGARLAAASASAAAEQLSKAALPAPATAAPAPPPAFSTASTVSFGGAPMPTPPNGLFGGAPSPAPAGGLFGGAPSPAPSGGLFGGAPSPAPSGGLFGSVAPAPASGAPASGAPAADAAADRRRYRAATAEKRVTVFGFAPRASTGALVPPAPTHAIEFVRFRTTGTRLPSCAEIQIAQLVVFDALGTALDLTDATNPGGLNPPNEEPAKALDGTPKTKWLDARKGALECRLAKGAAVLGKYMLVTANDCPERDPVRWVLEGSSTPLCMQVLTTAQPRGVLEGSSTPLCMQVLTTAPAPPLPTGGCSRDGIARPIRGVSSTTRAARISRCPLHGTRRTRSCCRPRAAGCPSRAAACAQVSRYSRMRVRSSWARACASGTASRHRKVGVL